MIRSFHVTGYRSVQDLRLELGQVNVLTGPNGCGKSNLYNAMLLLHRASEGRFAHALSLEGGMESALWAGRQQKRKAPRRIGLQVETEDLVYDLACGLPQRAGPPSAFDSTDPEIKEEYVYLPGKRRPSTTILERKNNSAFVHNVDDERITFPFLFSSSESVLAQLKEPHRFPALSGLREGLRGWRFYHQFRTDADAPIRHPQVGCRSPVLDHAGENLAAAFQTIFEIGDGPRAQETIARCFSGAQLRVDVNDGRFAVALDAPSLLRPLAARELSDGTLRFLCLLCALLSPRPPKLLALNEPESSLHPDLLEPLAELIAEASQNSQLWITTHSRKLVDHIAHLTKERPIELALSDSATVIAG